MVKKQNTLDLRPSCNRKKTIFITKRELSKCL